MLEAREIYTEMSMLEEDEFRCPECKESLRGRQTQRIIDDIDNWHLRIRCSCGKIVVAIND